MNDWGGFNDLNVRVIEPAKLVDFSDQPPIQRQTGTHQCQIFSFCAQGEQAAQSMEYSMSI